MNFIFERYCQQKFSFKVLYEMSTTETKFLIRFFENIIIRNKFLETRKILIFNPTYNFLKRNEKWTWYFVSFLNGNFDRNFCSKLFRKMLETETRFLIRCFEKINSIITNKILKTRKVTIFMELTIL